jgi:hypothetical protein
MIGRGSRSWFAPLVLLSVPAHAQESRFHLSEPRVTPSSVGVHRAVISDGQTVIEFDV